MLEIKLANDSSFEISSLHEIYDGQSNISTLTIVHEIKEADASQIQGMVTPENIKSITLTDDGAKLDEFTKYDTIVAIEKL